MSKSTHLALTKRWMPDGIFDSMGPLGEYKRHRAFQKSQCSVNLLNIPCARHYFGIFSTWNDSAMV